MIISKDAHASYKLLKTELISRGYSAAEERIDGRLCVSFVSPSGATWRTMAANIRYLFTNETDYNLSVDKASSYKFANSKGVSVPFTRRVSVEEGVSAQELEDLCASYAPLIVKPNDSSLSKGLTLNIRDAKTLTGALTHAVSINRSDVLIQQQVTGEEIRFVVMDGRVVAALLRQTPRVVGDGVSTVQELIRQENVIRQDLVFPYISYPQLTPEIINKKFFEDISVPPMGDVIELSRATMIRNGCSVYEVLADIHESHVAKVEHLASSLNTNFFVVDVLIEDYAQPLREDGYWFLEFNTSPVLKLFYGCRDGTMFDILPMLATLIDRTLQRQTIDN